MLLLMLIQQPKPVTFTEYGAPIARTLSELSAVCGMRLEATPAMRNEVLSIAVNQVPLEDLLAKIAEASQGRWDVEGPVHYLKPDVKARKLKDQALKKIDYFSSSSRYRMG